ncbi:MAG: TolC family protein, partial [Kiritimatiellia bacterium]
MALLALAAPAAEKTSRNLTLADCVGLALENNLDLRIERISRAVAQQDVAAAQGGYDPNLTLSAKRTHEETAGSDAGTAAGALDVLGSETDNDALAASVGGATALGGLTYELGARLGDAAGTREGNPFDTSTGSASITLAQPLLKGFKTDAVRYQVAVARKQSAEAAAQLEARIQDVLAQVETAWYGLIEARESIRVQEDAVQLATQLYEDNRRKVQIGALSRLDEKQAESQAAAARAALSSAKRADAEAQNQLRVLLYAD